jgi:primosomal protein N'
MPLSEAPVGEDTSLQVLGPSEAFLERAKGIYRWDILLKSPEIRTLHRAVYGVKNFCLQKKWPLVIDIDPYGTN